MVKNFEEKNEDTQDGRGKITCKQFLLINKYVHRASNAFMDKDHFITENFISLSPHKANKALKSRSFTIFSKKIAKKAMGNHNLLLKKICTNTSRN